MGCDFSFVHCADLHLGSRFWGIRQSNTSLGERLYKSTFMSFSKIVDIAIEKADFMVISGDIYDELVETPRTRAFFASEMERLGKQCFIVTGNHDSVHSWSKSIPYPPNVHEFGKEPEVCKINIRGINVEITGISYSGNHTDENLAAKLKGSPGVFTIGVVHCSVSSMGGVGDGYAPCSEEDLKGKDIDYWALGHIHKKAILNEFNPTIVYPGNIQGRDVNEPGDRGCMLVEVTENHPRIVFIPTQSIKWINLKADITGKSTITQLVDSLKKDITRDSIVSLEIIGKGNLNNTIRKEPKLVVDELHRTTGATISIKKITCVENIDLDKERDSGTLISEILKASDELSDMTDQELLELICSNGPTDDIKRYLQYYADRGRLKELLNEATTSVIDRLMGAKS